MQMKTYVKEIDLMTELMNLDNISITMGLDILDIEKKINNMIKAQKHDLMELNILENMLKQKNV